MMNKRIVLVSLSVVMAVGALAASLLLLPERPIARADALIRPAAQQPSGDLTVQKASLTPLGVEPGGIVTYYISYAWSGSEDAPNVRLTDTLPAEVTVISSTPPATTQNGQQLVYDVGTLPWTLPVGSIQIVGQVDSAVAEETVITNTVRISGDVQDTDTANNEAKAPVTIRTPTPDLWVFKWGFLEEIDQPWWGWVAEKGTEFNFAIWYFNFGSVTARNVVLSDTLPSGVELISAEPITYSQVGNQLIWDLGDLRMFDFGEIKLKVRPTMTGTFTNTVDISSDEEEEAGGLPNHSEFHFRVVTLMPPRITHPRPPLGGSLLVGPQTRFEGLARSGAEVVLYDGPEHATNWESPTFTPILTTTAGTNRVFSGTVDTLVDGDHYIYARAFSGTEKSEGGLWWPLHLVVSSTLSVDPEGLGVETGGQSYTPGGLGGEAGGTPGEPVTITVKVCPSCTPLNPTLLISETRAGEALPPLDPVDVVTEGGCHTYTFVFVPPSGGGSYDMQLSYTCDGDVVIVPIIIILIDPAGYVYDVNKAGGEYVWPSKPPNDSLIVNAAVTCTVRTGDNTWEVWDASQYEQHNPQMTDRTTADGVTEPGYYAFFVPPGQYKIIATASECAKYESPILTVVDEPVYHNVGMRCTPQSVTGVDYKIYLPLVIRN